MPKIYIRKKDVDSLIWIVGEFIPLHDDDDCRDIYKEELDCAKNILNKLTKL